MKNTFIYNNHLEAKKVLSTLEKELELCDEFIFSVAFISESGSNFKKLRREKYSWENIDDRLFVF